MTHPFSKSSSRKKKRKPAPNPSSGSASGTPASSPVKHVTFAPIVTNIPAGRPRVKMPPLPTTPRPSSLVAAPKTGAPPGRMLRAPATPMPTTASAQASGPRVRMPPLPTTPRPSLQGVPKMVQRPGGMLQESSAEPMPLSPEGVPKTAEPVAVQPVRTDLFNKTRRNSVELSGFPVGPARSKLNTDANNAAMEQLYARYYQGGQRVPKPDLNAVYSLMGYGATKYGEVPVTTDEYRQFMQTPNSTINSQKVSDYNAKMAAYKRGDRPTPPTGPSTADEAVKIGDYFHVHNGRYKSPNKKGTARRIIVNVNSQKAGLKVTSGLNDLIKTDPKVAGNLSEYKIYLSQTKKSGPMKHDKLVIYYSLDPTDPDGSDTIGNKIAAKIQGSVKPEDLDPDVAPFYSNVGQGLAWAEEPKYYVGSMTSSFTTERSKIVKQVIASNAKIGSKEEFIAKVDEAMKQAGVDAASPHRHQIAQ